uniref:GIY-YIG domain-containing protein n=1 Tax=Armillaria solidipes TaxID=1076256 RepID=A0A4D6FF02_9AGAR|nr:hypothetical protein [Armillaria solidipes]QCB16435.1 hypothetical protein [Armillaria solidipes]
MRGEGKPKIKENYSLLCFCFIILIYFLFLQNKSLQVETIECLYCSAPVLVPLKTYTNLSNVLNNESFRTELKKVGGVYGFINVLDKKQYIGSSKDLFDRFTDHFRGVSTNIRLQRAIAKHGIDNFIFVVYYFHNDPSVILTDIETVALRSFPFDDLYNFKKDAKSMLGYKHTEEAINKMKLRLSNKANHPMYGKKHSQNALRLISKPGKLNPMYNKKHSAISKKKISLSLSKTTIGLYDINNNLVKTFINQVVLAQELIVTKSTISKYIKSKKLFQNKYYIRKHISSEPLQVKEDKK